MNEQEIDKLWLELVTKVRNEITEVVFTKANGDERIMLCSLQKEYLDEYEFKVKPTPVADGSTPAPYPDTLTVWDVEANGWRAIRKESLIAVR